VLQLPVQQFPDIAPPQVNINATYPGAMPPRWKAA
jgi:multidrug efflux pump